MQHFTKILSLATVLLSSGTSACQRSPELPESELATEKAPVVTWTVQAPAPTRFKLTATEHRQYLKISIPDSPEIPPTDLLDQVVIVGVGGGEHVCRNPSEVCVEPRENGVYLVGFEPKQEVIVLIYLRIGDGPSHAYNTEWQSTVGADGTLWIEISNLRFWPQYVVLDASTHVFLVASAPLELEYQDYYLNQYFPCTQAASESRLKLGDRARVAYVNGANLRLRSSPDNSALNNVIGGIAEGTVLYIDFGPECQGGWIWWKVFYGRQYGWISEGDGTDWFLEPWK